jgi:hypothetical protein
MIRHIVMFKLKRMDSEENLTGIKNEIKDRLESLPGKVDVIRKMEVGLNIVRSDRAYDLVLDSSFDNLEDLETYREHPAHQEVVSYIANYKDKSAAVDFIS